MSVVGAAIALMAASRGAHIWARPLIQHTISNANRASVRVSSVGLCRCGYLSIAATSSRCASSTSHSALMRTWAVVMVAASESVTAGSSCNAIRNMCDAAPSSPVTSARSDAASSILRVRSVRCGLSSLDRTSASAAATASPLRRLTRAALSRSAATCSSGSTLASARCHAWRSGSPTNAAARL